MTSISLNDLRVVVLAQADTQAGMNHARGRLFEIFIANLLHVYGYESPTSSTINYSSEGIELDVVTKSRLTRKTVIAECKAYTRTVHANELTNFYGKIAVERLTKDNIFALMVALPRLNPSGEAKARAIQASDHDFLYLSAPEIGQRLREEGVIIDVDLGDFIVSDPAVIVTEHGVYCAVIQLDDMTRSPISVLAWAAKGSIPDPVIDLIVSSNYAPGLDIKDVSPARSASAAFRRSGEDQSEPLILVTVRGSLEDFEYQLPASPRFFVGRKVPISQLSSHLQHGPGAIVLNAQSGWGKSSLALKFGDMAKSGGGYSIVLDSRTANDPRFVTEALRRAATEAAADGLLRLRQDASWASLGSSLRTLNSAEWLRPSKPLLVFFDQFENVFRSESITRAFRDLAAGVQELVSPVIVGFAWKTDLVGWTEGHPYQLRDEIRSHSKVIVVEPFGSNEVGTLLGRLEKQFGDRLSPDLRTRLREYSQGLPWLLKKLCDHVLRELRSGTTQERLLAEALNVQNLFDADLAQLSPPEQEAIRHVARYAPLPASEVTDRFAPEIVQSLVDRRLLVQIGERLDTYWDIFRDYLNTGRVPVEDSYILRYAPNSVSRIVVAVLNAGGSATAKDLTETLRTSPNVIMNLNRDLRLMGVALYDPSRVTLVKEVTKAASREDALRRRVAQSLRRHRAYTAFLAVTERGGGSATPSAFAKELPHAFPAVDVTTNTWSSYSRVFLSWFDYAGIVREYGGRWHPRPEGDNETSIRLTAERPAVRTRPSVPQEAPRRAIALLNRLGKGEIVRVPRDRTPDRDAVRTLLALGAVDVDKEYLVRLKVSGLVHQDGSIEPKGLLSLLEGVPGGATGIALLKSNPRANPRDVGGAMRESIGAEWTPSSTSSIGGHFRAWARIAGIEVAPVSREGMKTNRSRRKDSPSGQESLI